MVVSAGRKSFPVVQGQYRSVRLLHIAAALSHAARGVKVRDRQVNLLPSSRDYGPVSVRPSGRHPDMLGVL